MFNYLDPKVGDLVYESYTPSRAGKIIHVEEKIDEIIYIGLPDNPILEEMGIHVSHPVDIDGKPIERDTSPIKRHIVTVMFLKGETKTYDSIYLRPFDKLVEDHIRKAKKFSDVRAKLLAL